MHAPLTSYGWSERVAALAAAHPGTTLARVVRVDRGRLTCAATDGDRHVPPPREGAAVTGDWVALDDDRVVAGLPRWSLIQRGGDGGLQALAANVDVVAITVPADRPLNPRWLDRFLAVVWESGAVPVVAITKADLQHGNLLRDEVSRSTVGVDAVVTAATTGTGLDELRSRVPAGATLAFLGASGAGKSTLTNALIGREAFATGAVRASDAKGRHTTTHRELVPLPGGGVLLDTPGLRSVGIGLAFDGVEQTFADIAELARACRFRDCGHEGEPGCAVADAVREGRLAAERLDSYHRLQRELAHEQRQADPREARATYREWGRAARSLQRIKEDVTGRRRGD